MRTNVAFAAESGISPALALVSRLMTESPDARLWFFYGHRAGEHTDDLERLLSLKDLYLNRLSLGVVTDRDSDEAELLSGVLDGAKIGALSSRLFDAKAIDGYFVFGPDALAADARAALGALGVDGARIRVEQSRPVDATRGDTPPPADAQPGHAAAAERADPAFRQSDARAPRAAASDHAEARAPTAAGSSKAEVRAAATPGQAGAGTTASKPETQVSFVMDGRRRAFSMLTGQESILDAAARAGIELPFSCKAGVCSTCRTKLVRGEVDMAENYALEDWELEQGFILACQSRAKTPEIELTYDET